MVLANLIRKKFICPSLLTFGRNGVIRYFRHEGTLKYEKFIQGEFDTLIEVFESDRPNFVEI